MTFDSILNQGIKFLIKIIHCKLSYDVYSEVLQKNMKVFAQNIYLIQCYSYNVSISMGHHLSFLPHSF